MHITIPCYNFAGKRTHVRSMPSMQVFVWTGDSLVDCTEIPRKLVA